MKPIAWMFLSLLVFAPVYAQPCYAPDNVFVLLATQHAGLKIEADYTHHQAAVVAQVFIKLTSGGLSND